MISSNAQNISKNFELAVEVVTRNVSKYIAQALMQQIRYIKTRLAWEVNIDGSPFRPNSEAYAEKKRKVVGHAIPLDLSGSMADAIIFEMTGATEGRVFFSNRYLPGAAAIYEEMGSEMIPHAQKAEELEAMGYTFFGVSEKEEELLQEHVIDLVYKDVKDVLQRSN